MVKDKERRVSKKYKIKENKKFPYKNKRKINNFTTIMKL